MPVKLIAIDLDGTLLDSNKEIPQGNIDAINYAISQGVEVAFATGRIGPELDDIIVKLPQVRYALMSNGAIVKDLKNNKMIYSKMLSMDEARKIYESLKDFDMMFELFGDDVLACDQKCIDDMDFYSVSYIRDLILHSRVGIKDFEHYIATRQEPLGKINIFFPTSTIRDEALARVKDLPYEITHQEPTNLEFNVQGSNKGEGLRVLGEYLKINRNDIMAIGDNNNDLAMLEYANVSYAMANACSKAKEIAKKLTSSYDELGVAKAIYQEISK